MNSFIMNPTKWDFNKMVAIIPIMASPPPRGSARANTILMLFFFVCASLSWVSPAWSAGNYIMCVYMSCICIMLCILCTNISLFNQVLRTFKVIQGYMLNWSYVHITSSNHVDDSLLFLIALIEISIHNYIVKVLYNP